MTESSWFRCFVEGRQFPGVLLNEAGTVGFFTTVFVQAEGPEQAEVEAVAPLKQDKKLELQPGTAKACDARIFVTEIEEVRKEQVPKVQGGICFSVE